MLLRGGCCVGFCSSSYDLMSWRRTDGAGDCQSSSTARGARCTDRGARAAAAAAETGSESRSTAGNAARVMVRATGSTSSSSSASAGPSPPATYGAFAAGATFACCSLPAPPAQPLPSVHVLRRGSDSQAETVCAAGGLHLLCDQVSAVAGPVSGPSLFGWQVVTCALFTLVIRRPSLPMIPLRVSCSSKRNAVFSSRYVLLAACQQSPGSANMCLCCRMMNCASGKQTSFVVPFLLPRPIATIALVLLSCFFDGPSPSLSVTCGSSSCPTDIAMIELLRCNAN